jgi:hypothetical protein
MLRASTIASEVAGDEFRLRKVSNVKNFKAGAVDDEPVTKLNGNAARTSIAGEPTVGDLRRKRIFYSSRQGSCGENVSKISAMVMRRAPWRIPSD